MAANAPLTISSILDACSVAETGDSETLLQWPMIRVEASTVMLCCCGVEADLVTFAGFVGEVVFVVRGLGAFGVVEVGLAALFGAVESSAWRRARACAGVRVGGVVALGVVVGTVILFDCMV